ncbi:MAG: hypothetical protein ACXAAO_01490 [Candidatus Thorarchaeota archaeon]|jgi:hypothetical protein
MEYQTKSTNELTRGILLGHEIGDWAGFISGRLTVKKEDGTRVEFRLGKESLGVIPIIGSLIAIEHTTGALPEIVKLDLINDDRSTLYKDAAEVYSSTLFLGKPNAVAVFAITEIIVGILMLLLGYQLGARNSLAPVIFGGCGVPHIFLGYLLWNYAGE